MGGRGLCGGFLELPAAQALWTLYPRHFAAERLLTLQSHKEQSQQEVLYSVL